MRLLAPINSLDSCKAQIRSGAEEVYVGLRTDYFTKFSFSAKNQIDDNGAFLQPTKQELKEIAAFCKTENVQVNFTANVQYFSDFMQKEIDMQQAYIDYVTDAVDCGINHIIVTDIGLMYLLKELELPIQIHASTTLDTMSLSQIEFLKQLGVTRTVLSYQVSYPEIKEIVKRKPMEIEVFGYGGCSFSHNCNFSHGLSLGILCKNKYVYDGCGKAENILDLTKGCGLCSVYDLHKLGVDTLKLLGRENHYKQVSPITELFGQVLDLARHVTWEEYDRELKSLIPMWWKKAACNKNQCKFKHMSDQFYI